MDDDGAIEGVELELGQRVRLKIGLKILENKRFIDVRKWQKYPNSDSFTPTKKGLMISLKDWKRLMPLIQDLIKRYDAEELVNTA